MTEFPITYFQTSYGETILGRYDESTGIVHKAATLAMQQTREGTHIFLVPTGAPHLAQSEKEFVNIKLEKTAIGYSVNLSDPQASVTMRNLRKTYESAVSSLILNGAGSVKMQIPTN